MGPVAPQKKVFTSETRTSKKAPEQKPAVTDQSGISNSEIMAAIESLREEVRALTQQEETSSQSPGQAAPPSPGQSATAASLTSIFEGHTEDELHQLRTSLAAMSRNIKETKAEIIALRPQDSEEDRLMIVSHELDAVVNATEGATETILNCAERIDDLSESLKNDVVEEDEREKLDLISAEVVSIFEACNFQDLTGQRINKVVNTLKFVEERIMSMIEIWGSTEGFIGIQPADKKEQAKTPPDDDAHLLNGPQHQDKAISQDDIDALFD